MVSTDRRAALVRSYADAAEIVAGLSDQQLGLPTPCPDYNVSVLVDHIVGAGWRAVALGRGERPTGEEFPHVDLASAPDQLRRAGKEAEEAWADDTRLDESVTMPWGETYTGAVLVDMYLVELAGHAWDLAFATRQLDRLEPGLPGTALDAAHAMLKPEYRDLMGVGNPFGAEVPAPADASEWEVFAAFLGRNSRS
ncbi:MAG TPA: TIGR03086 family metal-binding protein [Acidimicrobiales bacterium]|nr:TIGR03086 family metal-binding protein [Acidimicrobiales bacterium]